jgi:Protein of unknown function (DUF1674)
MGAKSRLTGYAASGFPASYNSPTHDSSSFSTLLPMIHLGPLRFHINPRLLSRSITAKPPITRPAPHPLPPEQQREFELLQRQMANAPPGREKERHPDAPVPLKAEFDGDINPATGERGGPKREPIQRWIEEEGDWSFKGRVSDF